MIYIHSCRFYFRPFILLGVSELPGLWFGVGLSFGENSQSFF